MDKATNYETKYYLRNCSECHYYKGCEDCYFAGRRKDDPLRCEREVEA